MSRSGRHIGRGWGGRTSTDGTLYAAADGLWVVDPDSGVGGPSTPFSFVGLTVSPVPEPGSAAGLCIGFVFAASRGRRRPAVVTVTDPEPTTKAFTRPPGRNRTRSSMPGDERSVRFPRQRHCSWGDRPAVGGFHSCGLHRHPACGLRSADGLWSETLRYWPRGFRTTKNS